MSQDNQFDKESIENIIGGSGVWIIITLVIVAVLGFKSFRMGEVSGEQVGVILDKMSGDMEVIEESGVKIYNSIIKEFFTLDKTVQTLDMTEDTRRGDRTGKDDLKVKTIDGSDVYLDLQVRYEIITKMADVVLRTSGPGENYKMKWMRDYVRSIARNCLGELTTEEFYDSSKRNEKSIKAKEIINKKIKKFGLIITDIGIPQTPHFYKEYEDMIKKKKLADQEELEEKSLALAAQQIQKTEIQIAENNKTVELTEARGIMKQSIIQAEAEGQRLEAQAKAYFEKIKVGADADLYKMKKQATGILAQKKAEAEGIQAMKQALEGEGGRNMVKMEYAKKLKYVTISAQPFSKESHIGRFEVNKQLGVK